MYRYTECICFLLHSDTQPLPSQASADLCLIPAANPTDRPGPHCLPGYRGQPQTVAASGWERGTLTQSGYCAVMGPVSQLFILMHVHHFLWLFMDFPFALPPLLAELCWCSISLCKCWFKYNYRWNSTQLVQEKPVSSSIILSLHTLGSVQDEMAANGSSGFTFEKYANIITTLR